MKKTILAILAVSLVGPSVFGAAEAASVNMVTTARTSQPIGHYEFCSSHAGECGTIASGPTAPMALTREKWEAMLEVNADTNRGILPLTDKQIHGVEEYWSYPDQVGDCEDFVLEKRRLLLERGFSPSDLLITVVMQPDGSGHAVLTVRTDHGDFILDNMRNRVLLWSDTEYTYLKRQSSEHAGRWMAISDNREPMAVGSVR